MNCADARHLIHLEVGGDLQASEEHQLAGHLERCGECRADHASMLKAMAALHALRDFDPAVTRELACPGSVWASVAARLPPGKCRSRRPAPFNTRVAALCVCSLALAVVTIVQHLPVSGPESTWSPALPAQMVTDRMSRRQASPTGGHRVPGNANPGGLPFEPGTRFQVVRPDGTVYGYLEPVPVSDVRLPPPTADQESGSSF